MIVSLARLFRLVSFLYFTTVMYLSSWLDHCNLFALIMYKLDLNGEIVMFVFAKPGEDVEAAGRSARQYDMATNVDVASTRP